MEPSKRERLEPSSQYRLTGIDRAVAILEAFGSAPLTLSEISRRAGLSQPTTLRYLASLGRHGFIERDERGGRYQLGLRLFELGHRALNGRDPRAIALPTMERLREQFGETVNLAAWHGNELILIEVLEGTRSIKKGASVGDKDQWHSSSLGKAILAALPDEEVRTLLGGRELVATTPRTITDLAALLVHLTGVRARGYAVDDQEAESDLCCVGTAILDRQGRPSCAISIAGPANRFTHIVVEEMGKALKAAAADISSRLGYLANNSDGAGEHSAESVGNERRA